MVVPPTRPDVVIIGAGAAGIAAGRALARRRTPFLILEGRERVGGRAVTGTFGRGHQLDLGCAWLHSADRNVLAALARDHGVVLDTSLPPWRKRREQVGFDLAAQKAFDGAADAFWARLEEAGGSGRDAPASSLLEPGGRWNHLLDAISTYYNGAPLDRVSIVDFDRYVDTETNWRTEGGYGALVASLAEELPIRLGCRVTRVDASGRALRIDTDDGTIETDRVIVTVPTDVLASGAIRFDPALDDHMAAAAGLPLGLADKIFFEIDDPGDLPEDLPDDAPLWGGTDRTDVGSYTLRDRGRPVLEGYFGGDYARHLEKGGRPAFIEASLRELKAALGRDIAARLTPLVATAWAADPFAMGSYSHALPGHADARATLATPVDGRIVFAGEATSRSFFSTAHGAWEEGERAARAVMPAGQAAAAAAHP